MCPGQRTIPTVRIEPSQGSPSSPRQGPAEAQYISSGSGAGGCRSVVGDEHDHCVLLDSGSR